MIIKTDRETATDGDFDREHEHQKLLSVFDAIAKSRGLIFSQERLEMMVDNALTLYEVDLNSLIKLCEFNNTFVAKMKMKRI